MAPFLLRGVRLGEEVKRYLAAMALALVAGLSGVASHAATILPKGETTVLVTANLRALGLKAEPTGTASVTTSDRKPLYSFPITGGTADAAGNLKIEHEGSGVLLFARKNSEIQASVGNFLIDTLAGTVSGIVNGAGPSVVLFTLGELTPRGISLDISSVLAGALTAVFGAPDLTGVRFGLANTAPEIAPVPLPATGLALLGALVGLGALRRRRETAAAA